MKLVNDFIHLTDMEFFIKYWWQILIFAGVLFGIIGVKSLIVYRKNHK